MGNNSLIDIIKIIKSTLSRVLYFLPYLLVGITFLGWYLGDWWTFITPIFVYGIINIADYIVPDNPKLTIRDEKLLIKKESALTFYSFAPILWPLTQFCFIGLGVISLAHANLTFIESCGLILSIGVMAGAIGITFSHELIHRKKTWERLLGEALLVMVTYHHWSIEHVYGHHRTVATPQDPATARLGESFYAFFPRTVIGGFISAINIEVTRLRRRKKTIFGIKNRVLIGLIIESGIYLGIFFGLGWESVVGFAAISFIAIFQLEVVNYFEHYGLSRREISPGRFESVKPYHSWDDGCRVSSWFLANLQRHADHHMRPGVRYESLKLVSNAPHLPAGYATMLLIALFPPLWFAIMNPRARAERDKYKNLYAGHSEII
tara:strand:- start:27588 stop:28721 length:1134 start_codon:yes stop_codon:yes gene_type:complete